jgi:hypothetical protein
MKKTEKKTESGILTPKAQEWFSGSSSYELPCSDLQTYGQFKVTGEDGNADLAGPHHEPVLGILEGPLWAVINEAVTLKGFYAWGRGGKIVPYKPREVKIRKVYAALSEDDKKALEVLEKTEREAAELRASLKARGVLLP